MSWCWTATWDLKCPGESGVTLWLLPNSQFSPLEVSKAPENLQFNSLPEHSGTSHSLPRDYFSSLTATLLHNCLLLQGGSHEGSLLPAPTPHLPGRFRSKLSLSSVLPLTYEPCPGLILWHYATILHSYLSQHSVNILRVKPIFCNIQSHHFMANRWGQSGSSDRFHFLGLQSHRRRWLQPWN